MQQTADRTLMNELFNHGFISQQARDSALEHLYPHRWGAWMLQVLSYLGAIFVLAGVIYYFAYNWEKMSAYYKFSIIEISIIICLVGSWSFLDKLAGKIFLTAASILIGVFMAVFGQIYQTGADASTLFITWFILIFPWVFISQFEPLWFIWIIIVNLALILFWQQESSHSTYYLYSILILLNTGFLFLKEYLSKFYPWLQGRWSRILLVIGILIIAMVSINTLILDTKWFDTRNSPLVISSILGLIIQGSFLYYYRKLSFDKWVYALTILSLCIILSTLTFRLLENLKLTETLFWLLMSFITLFVFSTGAFILRK